MGCCASADDKLLAGSSSKTPEIPSGYRQSDSKGLSSAWDFVGDEKLGSGAFGDVYLIKNRDTGRLAAVKVQKKSGMQEEDKLAVLEEVRIMKLLKHRNIVQFIDFFDEEDNMYVVIEYLAGGTMFDRVVKKDHYNEKEARDLIYIFLKAVQHCHDRNVIHRDIKPENMLMVSESDDADVKLADFGLSILLEEGQMCDTPCGTPCYVSPEMISQPVKYSKPADMWAVGCIAFILLGGYPPFTFDDESRSSMVKMYSQIKKGQYTFVDDWDQVSDEAKNLVKGLLCVDPHRRLTVKQAIQHPWVQRPGDELARRNLDANLKAFRRMLAKRKFKAAVHGVIASNKFKNLIAGIKAGADTSEEMNEVRSMVFTENTDKKSEGGGAGAGAKGTDADGVKLDGLS